MLCLNLFQVAFVNEIWPPCDTEIWPPLRLTDVLFLDLSSAPMMAVGARG